ncbi:N-acetylmuramoyl-L-alanine amidase CwlD [Tumebacillus algifaecis]|uniref:N-acetylmuramoyl-L-alanine amidase CwlD n=1 Tax=Tumebacillus algifaecis TaxID=1214604 RepID=A0A223D659_9BACL|nr:N-acetylmuramoyl-L-alanine amidase CwlD [Tumebacillus algifaecis]ASS76896.1 N-acetylmuramoyl-L-alanine amidase CwlD [Tumebacillus algifaecis]
MWKRGKMPVWRFGVYVALFLIASFGLYTGTLQWLTEPSSLSWNLPLNGQVIVLDAGHGGVDPGAVSESGVLEKEIALQVAMFLRDYLQQAGAHVLMIREEDLDLADPNTKGYSRRKSQDLKERARIIRESDATVFISLHCNSIPSDKWTGAQTLFDTEFEDSKVLAEKVQEALRETIDADRGVKKREDLFLLKHAGKPGALVELGFLSNPDEALLMQEKNYQKKLALSIYKGLLAYYSEK